MGRQPRQKLTLAELLIVLALVGIALGLARPWWDAWKTEEWTLASAWLGAWILGVVGGRVFRGQSLLPACLLCEFVTAAVSVYFQFSWGTTFVVVVAALAGAVVTAGLPWVTAQGCQWGAKVLTGQIKIPRWALVQLAAASFAVIGGTAAVLWLRDSPVTTTVIRRFQLAIPLTPGTRRNRQAIHCISDTGRFMVFRSAKGIEVFDAESEYSRTVPNSIDLSAVAISPDGHRLGCLTRVQYDRRSAMACCVDADSGTRLVEYRVSLPFSTVTFPSSETFVVGTSSDGETRLDVERWRLGSTAELTDRWQFEWPAGGKMGVWSDDGLYCRVEYVDDDTVSRWQIWKVTPPAEMILDSKAKPFPWGREFHAHGEWFANAYRYWNRTLSTEVEIEGTVVGFDAASGHLAALRYSHIVKPTLPQVGLSGEVMDQLPFWRLFDQRGIDLRLVLYDVRQRGKIWKSRPVAIHPWYHSNQPVFSTHRSPNGSAIAVQDDTGKIVLWRIHRSPFDDR